DEFRARELRGTFPDADAHPWRDLPDAAPHGLPQQDWPRERAHLSAGPPRSDLRGCLPRRRPDAAGPLQLVSHGRADDPPLRARDPRLPAPFALREERGEPGAAHVTPRTARR